MHQVPRRSLLVALGVASSLAATRPALAHGPTRQRVTQTVDIARSPAEVWALIENFDSIARWHPAIASSPATKGNEVGSVRALTLRAEGDPGFEEELTKYDAAGRSYAYRILAVDPKVLPVNTYSATMEVRENPAGGSTVEWRAAFYRGYMLNNPPPDQNDAAAAKAVTGVLRTGLDHLKAIAETKG